MIPFGQPLVLAKKQKAKKVALFNTGFDGIVNGQHPRILLRPLLVKGL